LVPFQRVIGLVFVVVVEHGNVPVFPQHLEVRVERLELLRADFFAHLLVRQLAQFVTRDFPVVEFDAREVELENRP
jgi:hypothetical protein